MISIVFVYGSNEQEVSCEIGSNLLECALSAGVPLDGPCGGVPACAACHVTLDSEWFDKIEPKSRKEEDVLDFASGVTKLSRLACQVIVTEAMNGMKVYIPQKGCQGSCSRCCGCK